MQFGDRLRELREDKGLRQEDVAALFGFGKSTVSQWENGKSEPEYDIVLKLADYFDVTTDYLLGRSSIPYIKLQAPENATPEEIRSAFAQMVMYSQVSHKAWLKGLLIW